MNSENQFHICAGCTCLCDDILINDAGQPIVDCEKGRQWFAEPVIGHPKHFVDGRESDLESALKSAADQMSAATAPLMLGLDRLDTAAQQAAWKIAQAIGATIDTRLSSHGRGSIFSLQRTGKVTASLGEVAQRSDFVVFWFCDPVTTHPRHLERYSSPPGKSRTLIVVDDHPTATSKLGEFIQLSRDDAANGLDIVRRLLADHELDDQASIDSTGQPTSVWQALADQMKAASYGALFYGHPCDESDFDRSSDSLARLIRDLNQLTRFVSLGMRTDANTLGAENVLAWSCGYPFAVNLQRQQPRSHWLEYSAASVLQRRECDLIFCTSAGSASAVSLANEISKLPQTAQQHFASTPKIVLTDQSATANDFADVCFQVSTPGKNGAGDFCRQDDVALPMSPSKASSKASTNAAAQSDSTAIAASELLKQLLGQLSLQQSSGG